MCSPSLSLSRSGGLYKGHVDILAPTVQELANLEREAQTSFLQLGYLPNQLFKAFWTSLITNRQQINVLDIKKKWIQTLTVCLIEHEQK